MPSSSNPITPTIRSTIRTYALDGDLILFDEQARRLFALNSTASVIWRGLAQGLEVAEIVGRWSRETGVERAHIEHDVALLLEQWRRAGLLEPSGAAASGGGDASSQPPAGPVDESLEARPVEAAFRLMDAGVRVVADAEIAPAIVNLLGHLGVTAEEAAEDWPLIEIFERDGRWVVTFDEIETGECSDASDVVPLVFAGIAMLAYYTSDCFAAVHGSAVAKGSRCVLLPGEPGSGKSTLTTALVAGGFRYCTDDLAILVTDPIRLRPVPLHIGVKSGAWPVVGKLWPEVKALPAHRREDGQLIKYFLPPYESRVAENDRFSIAAMVFPRFVPGGATRLRSIPRSEALTRMTEAGYDLTESLDADAVRVLVEWFEELPCYELHFEDVNEAVGLVSGLFA